MPLEIPERLRGGEPAGDSFPGNRRLLFLVGVPRSGTTWLQLLLSQSQEVATANETHLIAYYMRSMFERWESLKRNTRPVGLHYLMGDAEYHELLRQFAIAVMRKMLATNPGASVVLEKTPGHLKYWRDVLAIFPEAYFLHIIRDPRAVVASQRAANLGFGSQWAYAHVLPTIRNWTRMVEQREPLAAALGERYREVRYEDLHTERAPDILHSIYGWVGLDMSRERCVEAFSRYTLDNLKDEKKAASLAVGWELRSEPAGFFRNGQVEAWEKELSRREIALIEHVAGGLMDTLGYRRVGKAMVPRHLLLLESILQGLEWRLSAWSS